MNFLKTGNPKVTFKEIDRDARLMAAFKRGLLIGLVIYLSLYVISFIVEMVIWTML